MPSEDQTPKPERKIPKTRGPPNRVVSTRFQAVQVLAVGADSGHHLATSAGQGGAPPLDDRRREISRPATAGPARIGPANTAAAATLGHRISPFSGHSSPTHTSLPPLLDPLNSFPWSFSPDSSPFERYDKTNFADSWIKFSGHHSNLWTKVRVLMCSWSLGLSVDIKFVNFGRRLVSFPFSGNLG